MRAKTGIMCGTLAVLLFGLCPAIATAQSSVRGSGTNIIQHGAVDGGDLFQHVAVNAYLDQNGVAQGMMTWEGTIFQALPNGNVGAGGPSDPFIFTVTDLSFSADGTTAYVTGVVIASPQGLGNGHINTFSFTDNSGNGEPDEIDTGFYGGNLPIDAGNITIR